MSQSLPERPTQSASVKVRQSPWTSLSKSVLTVPSELVFDGMTVPSKPVQKYPVKKDLLRIKGCKEQRL